MQSKQILKSNPQNNNNNNNATTTQLKEKKISFDITFRDSGCGISQENLEKLFLNFSRLQETAEVNKQGVGIGLSICKQIVDLLGGEI